MCPVTEPVGGQAAESIPHPCTHTRAHTQHRPHLPPEASLPLQSPELVPHKSLSEFHLHGGGKRLEEEPYSRP